MKLAQYLKEAGIRQTAFAERVGVTVQTVHHWVRGHRVPDLPSAVLIEGLTKGRVKPRDFVDAAEPFTCSCGETFPAAVWHCAACGSHWSLDRDTCPECIHKAKEAKRQARAMMRHADALEAEGRRK